MARRWTTVAVVLLVLVDLGLVYVLLTRHYGGSDGKAPATSGVERDSAPTPARRASPSATARTFKPNKAGRPASGSRRSGKAIPFPTHTAFGRRSSSGGHLLLDRTALVADPFRPVGITGAWTHFPANTHPTVRVEMLQGDRWSAFPLPAVVNRFGRFTAYAALGPRGQYRLRVVGPGGEPVSNPVVVTVR